MINHNVKNAIFSGLAIFIAALELYKYSGEIPYDNIKELHEYSVGFLYQNCLSFILLSSIIINGYNNFIIKLSAIAVVAINVYTIYKLKFDVAHENQWYDWLIFLGILVFIVYLGYKELK